MKYLESEKSIALMKLNALWKIDSEKMTVYKRLKSNYLVIILFRFLKSLSMITYIGEYGLKITLLKMYWWVNRNKINNFTLRFDDDFSTEFADINDKLQGKKVVVYSAVFGGYDSIKEPLYVNDNIDYVMFTDQEIPKDSAWRKYEFTERDGELFHYDSYHKSKYVKIHPELFFPDYDYSVWLDGNILIVADLLPLVMRISESSFMATFNNPCHDDIYTEARFCVFHDAVSLEEISKQVNDYKHEGFPEHFGMREFSLIIRRHNEKQCIDLMNQWWKQLQIYTMRDQISFPFVLWKNGLTIETIENLGVNWRWNPRLHCCPHVKNHIYSDDSTEV